MLPFWPTPRAANHFPGSVGSLPPAASIAGIASASGIETVLTCASVGVAASASASGIASTEVVPAALPVI